ncbi:MAG: glycogen debranching N-terminal domain-containing protein, partial [Actinomycetota bacterium]
PDATPPAPPRPVEGAPPVLVTDLASRTLAVKEDDAFLYSDLQGDLHLEDDYGLGFYARDTRYLSRFHMTLSGRAPVLLSSTAERGYLAQIDLTNPDLVEDGEVVVPQQTLNVRRARVVDRRLLERVRVKNYRAQPARLDVGFELAADFADIFEVRGMLREDRPAAEPPRIDGRVVTFARRGRDGVLRSTRVVFDEEPDRAIVDGASVHVGFALRLGPYQTRAIGLAVEPVVGEVAEPPHDFDVAVHGLRRSYEEWERGVTRIVTDNEVFNGLLDRSLRDLRLLSTRWEDGHAAFAAGVPWYVAVFGRDALLTSHQVLMLTPAPARSTLEMLAAHQGTRRDDWRDEEPGKILHEIRRGELAAAGSVPHTTYYGSVDATPLFVLLAAQYFRWTGDRAFAAALLPAVERALAWIDGDGDVDGDGFLEYVCRSPRGIRNQGWKDSHDAMVHADGVLAEPPIALSEVQGYVHLAKLRFADVYADLGRPDDAARLRAEAAALRRRYDEAFWLEDEGYYAAALDADKRPIRTVMSNPAHGLYCQIVEPARAEHVARRLLSPDMFSGWGIRTMSKGAVAYNPMSYHNGSVWPHDNAFIAAGLKRYGLARAANRVATALFDAAVQAETLRLPELFCGFTRRAPNRPVRYPVACSPQAWAAGSPFLLLQAMLGLSARADLRLLTVHAPSLPTWLNAVEIRDLRVADARLSLVFRREGEITSFSVLAREGDVRVVMEE